MLAAEIDFSLVGRDGVSGGVPARLADRLLLLLRVDVESDTGPSRTPIRMIAPLMQFVY